jgi:hypothetical protein
MERKDRTYLLVSQKSPINFMLTSRHTNRKPLLFFDESGDRGVNRALRYAKNQKSPFIDEQDENAILEAIVFVDGVLTVPFNNPVLQEFLHYHPGNKLNGGGTFYEFDPAKEAEENINKLNTEVDALILARTLDIRTMEAIARVYLKGNVDNMSSSELKRDILLFAKNNPKEFLEAADDQDLEVNSVASRALEEGYVTFRAGKDLFFNLKDNKKKIMTVKFGNTPEGELASWLHSQEGKEFYQFLSKEFEKEEAL